MNKKHTRKLNLSRATLRRLDTMHLEGASGGVNLATAKCGATLRCIPTVTCWTLPPGCATQNLG